MKKILFLSFICLVFAIFSNTARAQECCFYLEQMPEQVLSDKEGAQFHLNKVIPGVNNGVAEYYYFRFENCLNPKTKLSIDWEFLVNGEEWDKPLNATATNPRNLINVEIEWFLPLINNVEYKGSGPILSGMGLESKLSPFTIIDGVKRAVKTDFPGTIDNSPDGFLYGYFNPYNGTPRWYNFWYADFFEWACANNYFRIKITRYSTDDIQIKFKLMERTGGFEFNNHYIPNQQQDYMGGHNAALVGQIGGFDFGEPKYKDKEIVVCANEIVEYGIDMEGNPYVFENPNGPEGAYEMQAYVYFYNQDLPCPNNIDKIVDLTIIWQALPIVTFIVDAEPVDGVFEICLVDGENKLDIELGVDPEDGDYTYFIKKHHRLLNKNNAPEIEWKVPGVGEYIFTGYVKDNVTGCFSLKKTLDVIAHKAIMVDLDYSEHRPGCRDNELGWATMTSTDDYSYLFGYSIGELTIYAPDIATEYTFENLLDGDYIFFAIDVETECIREFPRTILPFPTTLTATATPNPEMVECFGGTVIVTVQGVDGVPPYAYFYEEEQFSGVIELPAGTYEFTVMDADECSYIVELEILEPAQLFADAEYQDYLDCFYSVTDVVLSGRQGTGTPPYRYFYIDAEGAVIALEGNTMEVGTGEHLFRVIDANDCEADVEVIITSPTELIADVEPWDEILCFGDSTDVKVIAWGGIEGYDGVGNYWRKAGTHTFTVIDANGCEATTSIIITEPPLLIPTLVGEPEVLCYGSTTTVTLLIEGGTLPYFFEGNEIEGVEELIADELQTIYLLDIEGVTAGTHIFTITDGNGCIAEIEVTVGDQDELILTPIEDLHVVCKGDEAIYTIMVEGGVPPYFYEGDELEGDEFVVNLLAGTHTIIVFDDNGCDVEIEIIVEEPEFPLTLEPYIDVTDSIWCFGGTAIVTINAEGGEEPYVFYVGEDGEEQTENTFVLGEGDYTFFVKDNRGCIEYYDFTVTEPDSLFAEESYTYVTCTEDLALVHIIVEGGVEPYTFWWDDGEEFDNETGEELEPGDYTITVIDANECEFELNFTVLSQNVLRIEAEITEAILCKEELAIVTVTVEGGTKPYTVTCVETGDKFEDVTEETVIFELPAGAYTFKVVDASEILCEKTTDTLIVTEPDAKLTAVAAIVDPILCFGENATIEITAAGGTGEYTFYYGEISNTTGIFQVYNDDVELEGINSSFNVEFIVVDEKECTFTLTFTVTQPRKLKITPPISVVEPILCFGGMGRVHVMAEGGTGLIYGTGNFEVLAGKHIYTVNDENGCTATDSIIVTQPDKLLLDYEISTEIDCFGGTAVVTIMIMGGTAPFYYDGAEIDGEEEWVADELLYVAFDIPGVLAGTPTFTITDANGCVATIEVEVTEPELLVLEAVILEGDEVKCHGETATITLNAVGGTEEYTFFFDGEELEGNTIQLPVGTEPYLFTVIDANGCEAIVEFEFEEPDPIEIVFNGPDNICPETTTTLTAEVEGGIPPYTYLWNTGATTATITNLQGGTYTVEVTDANDCVVEKSHTISYFEDVIVEIEAIKACADPEIMVTVSSSANATITIQGYDAEENVVIESLFETVAVVAGIPQTVQFVYSSGTADFIYFIATASVEGIPCDFTDASEEINYNNIPRFYAYAEPCGNTPAPACLDLNYKEVYLETPVNHYFRVIDYCKTAKDLHLSVQFTYKYQAPGEEGFIEIGTSEISNYLFTANGSFMRYLTPMTGCGSDVNYSHVSGNAFFPLPGVVNGGWNWQNNQYNFFTLIFFDNREITVQLPGFSVPGTYHIDYELVTHFSKGTKVPYGNKIDNNCAGRLVGGNGFYTASPGFDAVVLAAKTMIIEVQDQKDPFVDIPEVLVADATIYPNPATDNINIKVENIEGPTQVRIITMNGQTVLNQQVDFAKDGVNIKLPDLNPGIYFVNITSKDAVLTRKLTIAPKF
ncbi:MAG: T9SS type A sorting domain-containing protein [Lentimicrobiaceae bacterium]|nr:T9SS type A sorting domain-containing protein [Lentimicrobiaceae bacterium]